MMGHLRRHRGTGLIAEVFKNPADLEALTGTVPLVMSAMQLLALLLSIISNPSYLTLQICRWVWHIMGI